ncbi:hydantoinase/oxoprolinase family protein [Halosegnis sp.]|uniref:hydantoinase/oxoprolinase family protein n=1 Tax=Halosegnis sp. TaxID=2864959 RepID=UPI0035D3FE39
MTETGLGPRVGVDVGGTFTDVVLIADDELTTAKVPSTADQSDGVLAGIRKACNSADVAPAELAEFVHAMTVSVNALLERSGAETALVTTEGFRDVLEIGRQTRPALYDLDAEKPAPLVARRHRYELSERATTDGIETGVDETALQELTDELRAEGVESVAVAFLHAYAHPANEQQVAAYLREHLDVPVSVSHEVLAEFREFERTATTVADAYVTPAIDVYIGRLAERAREAGVPAPRVMQSNGGIASAEAVRNRAVTTVLSGPAAGVIGARRVAGPVADERGLDGLITFDMGGTSSDVSLVRDGEVERTTDTVVDGVPVRTPMVDVNTIGSGGGSVAWVDTGDALRVGPESAGADPGPACYGRGGEQATVTDAALLLGYIGSDAQLGGELSLDLAAARDVLGRLAAAAGLESPREAARGIYRVANAKMTQAVREMTVERGYDPRGFGLVAFGGAGPMHAVPVASELDIETVVLPLASGVLSAYGLLDADERYDAVRTQMGELASIDETQLRETFAELAAEVRAETEFGDPTVDLSADLRYVGQSFELTVSADADPSVADLRERFHAAHERAYGYTAEEPVEVVNLRATARVERGVTDAAHKGDGTPERGERTVDFGNGPVETPIYDRRALSTGRYVDGPAVLAGPESTAVVPPRWGGCVRGDGTLVVTRGETA